MRIAELSKLLTFSEEGPLLDVEVLVEGLPVGFGGVVRLVRVLVVLVDHVVVLDLHGVGVVNFCLSKYLI